MEKEEIISELAKELGYEPDEGEVTGNSYGNGIIISFGNEEYIVYESYEDAEEGAKEDVLYLIDDIGYDGLNWDALDGYESYVDEDWFEKAFREMGESYLDDLDDDEIEKEFGTTDRDEALEKYMENYQNPIQDYIDEFGENDFAKVVKENGLINDDELAEAIVRSDGPANSLATYDGKEIEFGNGMYAYRCN